MAKNELNEMNAVETTGIPTNVSDQEHDLLAGLLSAAEYKEELTPVKIQRGGKHMFTFRVHAISESDMAIARKKATTFMKNPGGANLPQIEKETDPSLYRSWKIFLATTEEDKQNIWGNKELKKAKNILNSVETIDLLLTAGEKDAVCDLIEEISGFGANAVTTEEFAKN